MHHLRRAMQCRQAPWATFWAIFTKLGMGGFPRFVASRLHGCGFENVE